MKSPNVYLKEIEYLSNKINGWYKLDYDQRCNVITNSYLLITEKMKDGKVPQDDYDQYKGYMFITIRNEILKYHVWRNKTITGKQSQLWSEEHPEETEGLKTSENDSEDLNQLKKAIKLLPPKQRALIRWKLRGWKEPTLLYAFNLKRGNYVSKLFGDAKSNLKVILNTI